MVHETFKDVFVDTKVTDPDDMGEKDKKSTSKSEFSKSQAINITSPRAEQEHMHEAVIIDETGKWLHSGKMEHAQFNQLVPSKYRVYDVIDDVKIYKIARVENKADNPYIRFRIEGGIKDGLNLVFYSFEEDLKIASLQIMTYYDKKKYKMAGLSWSSSMYRMDKDKKPRHKNKIC